MEKIKPYIRIYYQYTSIDWLVSVQGEFSYKELPARACRQEDFGMHPDSIKEFKKWKGYSMICPDFDNFGNDPKTWLMTGSMSSFLIKRGEFIIERCRKEHYHACKNDAEIDKFISDL